MRTRKRTSPRRSLLGRATFAFFTLLILGGGLFGTLWATGVIAFGAEPSREGQVAFPATAQAIPAFTKITQKHLINPETQKLHIRWVEEENVQPSMMRDLGEIIGRVTTHDISPSRILTEGNLLPKGTRPGLTAGVPPGKRAMTLDVSKIPGLESLRRGDVFDLLTSLPVRKESETASNVEYGVLLGGIKPPDTRAGQLQRQTGVKVLVRGGVMVAHTKGAEQSTEGGNALVVPVNPSRRTSEPQVNATIAVDPNEVMPITEALGLDVKIFCVAHSGHPEHPQAESFPELKLDGLVAVPATVQSVKAFSRITQADLADPVTGKLNVYYFSPDRIGEDWLTEFGELVGRVVSHDVEAGFIFSESDLMPPGTPEGLAASVPKGQVAVMVPEGRIEGLEDLQAGDRFDVLSTLPDKMATQAPPRLDWATVMGGQPIAEDAKIYEQLRTGIRNLTRDAVKLTANDDDKTAIALKPEEVTPFSQMLGRKDVTLQVVAHSGRKSKMVFQVPRSIQSDAPAFVSLPEEAESDENLRPSSDPAVEPQEVKTPVTTRPIKAFSLLTVEDFVDPATGQIRYVNFPVTEGGPDWETDITKLIDRVAARDIPGDGRRIRSNDLLPPGTRPGVVAGIPPGMVAFTLSSQKADGLGNLKVGDEFLMVASRPFRIDDFGADVRWSVNGRSAHEQTASVGGLFEQADVTVVLKRGVLLFASEPENRTVRDRARSLETQQHLGPDGNVLTTVNKVNPVVESYEVAVQDFVIALDPKDVATLSEALNTNASMHAVLQTGNPQAESDMPEINENRPLTKARFIEHIRGQERSRELWLSKH